MTILGKSSRIRWRGGGEESVCRAIVMVVAFVSYVIGLLKARYMRRERKNRWRGC